MKYALDRLFKVADVLHPGGLVIIDVVIVPEQCEVS